jgi:glycosyltransferase involved in cell wall biosynthesis
MIDQIAGTPTRVELLVPSGDQQSDSIPEIGIVVPALNEQATIGEFVDWCWVGLKAAGVSGEVIIVDSSTDDTPNIAFDKGARVLRTQRRGLGQAYIDAVPYIRGQFIIMGDCDLTLRGRCRLLITLSGIGVITIAPLLHACSARPASR